MSELNAIDLRDLQATHVTIGDLETLCGRSSDEADHELEGLLADARTTIEAVIGRLHQAGIR